MPIVVIVDVVVTLAEVLRESRGNEGGQRACYLRYRSLCYYLLTRRCHYRASQWFDASGL